MSTRTALVVGAALLALLGVAGALYLIFGGVLGPRLLPGGSEFDQARAAAGPDVRTLPPPTDGPQTAGYLGADGAPLLAMHRVAVGQVESGGRDRAACDRDEAELTAAVPMDTAVGLITDVPDDPLRGLLDSEREALSALLAACPDPDTPRPDGETVIAALSRATALVDLRLDELGVPR